VSVFVIPPRRPALGFTPKPTRGLLKDVFQYLLERVLIGTELYVLSPEFIPVALGVRVDVRDPETEQQTLKAVRDALVAHLWPLAPGGADAAGWPLGEDLRRNELVTRVARVEGVRAVNQLTLFLRETAGWRRIPEGEAVTLERYQLPELMGVEVATGSGEAELPRGIGYLIGEGPAGDGRDRGKGVPAPVIPNLC
jgi:hypothetical protein